MTVFDILGYTTDLQYSVTASKTDLAFALVYVAPTGNFRPIFIMIL
jgi:hypothetical protein